MKKILALIVLSIAMVSCYEEYLLDYPYTAIYFYLQQDVRTFVVGEGMSFKVGATLGGVRENAVDRNANFTLDNSLITLARLDKMQFASQTYITAATANVAALELLPASHYTLSDNSKIVIKSGSHTGTITIKADSLAFTNDSLKTTRKSTYVLPFRLTDADADSLLYAKRTNVVGVILENKLFGKYWHGGSALVERPTLSDTTIKYFMAIPTVNENQVWVLNTAGPSTLYCGSYMNKAIVATDTIMKLTLKGNKVYLSAGPDAPFVITPDGESTFNNAKLLQDRRIYLNYKFTDTGTGYTYHCTDTLRFRNRIRDGINEWQDENPSHYEK
ncbi:MAG: DUF1735 domain-containing protein [Bacteroidales bacterium]|nr:DUF1735 domain-containing protein [Bacteroidales bacterium]